MMNNKNKFNKKRLPMTFGYFQRNIALIGNNQKAARRLTTGNALRKDRMDAEERKIR